MKTKAILIGLGAVAAVISFIAVAIGRSHLPAKTELPGAKTFEVHGQIRSVDTVNKIVRITHEAIPNYMPAMTMPFPVKDAALLDGLAAGDSVQFELVVTEDDAWVAHIEKIAADAAESAPVNLAEMSPAERETERMHAGELVPDFTLVDQDNRPVHLSDFRGQAVLLTFVYTRCPLPNFCPLMSKNFSELQKRLSAEFPGKYHLLSVSMDPDYDRPPVLKEYAARYDANPRDWTFATGTAEQIQFVASLAGLYYARENGLISHDLRTALIGPDGRLVHLWKSNVWTPYEVQRFVRATLTGTRDVAVHTTW